MKTIVVLGAGLAAAPVIRQTMKSTVLISKDYRMVVVNPTSQFLWPIAIPRAVVPGQFTDDKFIYDLEPTFKEYPADKFEFIVGTASSLDPQTNIVTVALPSGETRQLTYDALVVATGASAMEEMPFKMMDTSEHTIDKLHSIQKDIEGARKIVVAGGGTTGVETAGELGYEYSRTGAKEVYLIHSDDLPLSEPIIHSVRKAARNELRKLKVTLIPNTKVIGSSQSGDDIILQLKDSNGKTTQLQTQAYIPTFGLRPNTEFIPSAMLDSHGFVKQNKHLQAEGHSNIFVIGDAGNLEASKAMVADAQGQHLIEALPVFLAGGELSEYHVGTKETNAITLGRSAGTGHMGSFKIFSFLVWYLKGRFLGTDYAGGLAAGKRTVSKKFES